MSVAEREDDGEDLTRMRNLMALLEAMPDLLPQAERWSFYQPALAMMRRMRDEDHLCLCCGAEATLAFLSHHKHAHTNHWLDLCHWCGRKLYLLSDEEGFRRLDGPADA